MRVNPEAVLHFKKIAVPLLAVVAAAVGIWAVGLFGDYFEAHPLYAPIMVTDSLGIDVLGALAPICSCFSCLSRLLQNSQSPNQKIRYSICYINRFGISFQPRHP